MATARTATFQDMLNEYLAEDLLRTEYLKRDYIMGKLEKDNGWKGGAYIVPFEGADASSIEFGALADENDVSSFQYVRGQVNTYKEMWGTLLFRDSDLVEHNGKMNETTFLRILPDQLNHFMERLKMSASIQMGSGPHMATVVDDTNAATGVLVVDKVDRFVLGQKLFIDDDNSPALAVYVIAINVNTKEVTFSNTRGGTFEDLSAYSVAQNAKLYHPGAQAGNGFLSIRSALLSAANGGSASLHGQTKLAYPYLQAVNIDGAGINKTNILERLFDGYTEVRTRAVGSANTILMSYKHLGSIMKLIETQKGGYKVTPKDKKAEIYGWTEIEITSVKGALTLVGIQEWDDDIIAYIDWSAMKFASNGLFRKRKNPGNGNEFYEKRSTSGYIYLVDIALFGELIVKAPNRCGIIYGIPNYS